MSDKKFSVFISSTYTDLINIREKLMKTILKMNQFPLGMELFSAGDSAQWKVIEKTIQMTDYYVLILGHRYGSVGEDGIGYTEKEFNYAQELGIPIISFIRNEDVSTKPSERDDEPELKEKLKLFREKAKTGRMVEFWENENEIPEKLSIALMKEIFENPQVGWVRGNQMATPEILNELARLSKENSDLRALNETFIKRIDRKPNLEILINTKEVLNITFEKENIKNYEMLKVDYREFLKINKLKLTPSGSEFFENIFGPIKLNSGRNDKFKRYINMYNDLIKDEKLKEMYSLIENEKNDLEKNIVPLEILISNTGTSPAKNIYCKIRFPEIVKIINQEELKEIKEDFKQQQRNLFPPLPSMGLDIFSKYKVTQKNQEENVGYRVNDYEINILEIEIENILHSKSLYIPLNHYLLPKQKGEGDILLEVIAEEIPSPIELKIPLKIR